MDACGDNCECPEGTTGIEPFCEEEKVLAPIAPGEISISHTSNYGIDAT